MGSPRPTAGRKIINIDIKRAKGTLRPDREKKKPIVAKNLPCPPSALNKRAKQIFRHLVNNRLAGMGIASASHTEILAIVSKEMAELEILDKIIESEGSTFKIPAGEDEDGNPLYAVKARLNFRRKKNFGGTFIQFFAESLACRLVPQHG